MTSTIRGLPAVRSGTITPAMPRNQRDRSCWRRGNIGVGSVVLWAVLGGCSRGARVELRQPFAPPAQQRVVLRSDWVCSDDAGRWLLEFPLPAAHEGPRDFHIFLTAVPPSGAAPVASDQAGAARGMLMQDVGKLRGKTVFTTGRVRVRRTWWQRRPRLELDVRCDDGTTITGWAYPGSDTLALARFTREHATDVALLQSSTGQDAGGATGPRAMPE